MKGFNSQNQTIDLPPVEIMPPVLKGQTDSYGIQQYTVTGKVPSILKYVQSMYPGHVLTSEKKIYVIH